MINAKLDFNDHELHQILSVEREHHPKLMLTDIYKLYYQAFYGPGHITGDREQFVNWMRTEILTMKRAYLPDYQDIGAGKAFVRISLWPLKGLEDKQLEAVAELVYDSILEPAQNIDSWRNTWKRVVRDILPQNLEYDLDLDQIENILASGRLPHHSEIYSQAYSPHYRLIHISNLPILHGIIYKGQ